MGVRSGNTFLAWLASLALLAPGGPVLATTLPSGFSETVVASGLSNPTAMAFAPDGRLFVCQQGGQLRVIKNGALLPAPFLTVPVDSIGERGLLGVAFDPDFGVNGYVYIYYTLNSSPRHNRVSRFTANGDTALPGSETVILELDSLTSSTNHNGGALHFGPDGKLFIATGENNVTSYSQSLSSLLGKILRINPDGSIPLDNPFYNQTIGNRKSIWALGLRNPFTFAFQPGAGRMFINDVGQSRFEEINDGLAGANYGWPIVEGPSLSYRAPLYYYGHESGCAITGGAFYNPTTVQFPPDYVGKYFFADYCAGRIRRLDPSTATQTSFASGVGSPVDLAVGPEGSLYYISIWDGQVRRIDSVGSQAPQITQHPANLTVGVGQTATFTVAATGSAPLSYQWQRNGADIAGATSASYTTGPATLADNGAQFLCRVSNSAGSATSNAATLTVSNNQPPAGTITAPAPGALYSGGQTISYAGTGTDPEDGTLPPSAFTWRVDFHHDTHTHPFIAPTTGSKTGSFTIPTVGETSPNVWFRIYLTVKDSGGLGHTSYRDVLPRKATIGLATSPAGLQLSLDGQPVATPANVVGVVGIQRTLGVISPQTFNETSYEFALWSDGGLATHNISTPASDTTYTATFRPAAPPPGGVPFGLWATYLDLANGTSVSRVDSTINFNWGEQAPVSGIPADGFFVVWTGKLLSSISQIYTFYTQSDDGVRLWVDGKLLIDNWTDHTLTENSATLALNGFQKYSIRLEYYDKTGTATIRLLWSSLFMPKIVISMRALSPQ